MDFIAALEITVCALLVLTAGVFALMTVELSREFTPTASGDEQDDMAGW